MIHAGVIESAEPLPAKLWFDHRAGYAFPIVEEHPAYRILNARIGDLQEYPQAIACMTCFRVSYNQNDVKHRYCGFCKKFHEDPT